MNELKAAQLREDLRELGATGPRLEELCQDPERTNAALEKALAHGAVNVIGYVLKLVRDPSFGVERSVARSNLSAPETRCAHCGGDRFIEVLSGMAPCAACNAGCETSFYRADGTRMRSTPVLAPPEEAGREELERAEHWKATSGLYWVTKRDPGLRGESAHLWRERVEAHQAQEPTPEPESDDLVFETAAQPDLFDDLAMPESVTKSPVEAGMSANPHG